jgi:hypothetical protein
VKSTNRNNSQFLILKSHLQTYNKILKQSIRTAKKIYFEKCFNRYKFDIRKTWSSINEIINRTKKKSDFPDYFLVDGNPNSDKNFIANKFNEYYTNIGPELAAHIELPTNRSFKDYLLNPTTEKFNFSRVTENDIIKAIDNLKSKTSSGYDRISNKLLKFVKHEICTPVMLILNQSITHGTFPSSLKIAKVSPLYKKGDAKLLENYRPISILPSLSKIFEKIMYQQIYNHLSTSNLFYNSQYGFRSRHSTEFAAYELVERIINELDNNNVPLTIYLDLSKAFDTLDHNILLAKLSFYGFHDYSLRLIKSYLTNRKQYVDLNGTLSNFEFIKTGVPQGSILGPLLFIIYINDLNLASPFFHPLVYADDTTLFVSINTSDLSTIGTTINNELSNIDIWLKLNKLSLNTAKTKAMIFHMPQKIVQLPQININNHQIEFVDTFNFLGIVLDKSLRWTPHTDLIGKKISKINGILNQLKNYLPTNILTTIYNSLILPHLNYGTFLWGCKSKKINVLQKKSIRIISKSKFNAHTSGLFKNLGLLKFGDLCALHDLKLCYKIENRQSPEFFSQFHSSVSRVNSTSNVTTRFSSNIRIPRIKHEFSRSSIAYRYPNVLNNMPDNIKLKVYSHSWNGLKNYFKNIITASYSTVCMNENCFICNRPR